MTAFIRSLCLSALLAAGTAWAQQQPVDNPDNPHSTKAKDKQTSDTANSSTNQQVDQAVRLVEPLVSEVAVMKSELRNLTAAVKDNTTATQDVTVKDHELPSIGCPGDIVKNTDSGQCSAVVAYIVTHGDNCPGETGASAGKSRRSRAGFALHSRERRQRNFGAEIL